ncbi:hypothetical protein XACM_2936 [Xanthomonas euvesicatoria pv. citrumelo F1]|nr:hypothetical protein XACM_2936 [Xanthomonas euvesicatoria pv. citrumelo F1]
MRHTCRRVWGGMPRGGGGGDNATALAPPVAHDRCASAAQGLRRMQGDASFPHPLWMEVAQGCGQVRAGPGLQRCQDGWRKNDQRFEGGFFRVRVHAIPAGSAKWSALLTLWSRAGIERPSPCGEPGDHLGRCDPPSLGAHSRAAIDRPRCLGNVVWRYVDAA